ncbi:hypothetical protein BV20DRAFT_751127 [Pilatotrama ljubarskyi]|nr:hypothetical protein BV20DRAFT_751127 [Pilatotrama ljubarskyi]
MRCSCNVGSPVCGGARFAGVFANQSALELEPDTHSLTGSSQPVHDAAFHSSDRFGMPDACSPYRAAPRWSSILLSPDPTVAGDMQEVDRLASGAPLPSSLLRLRQQCRRPPPLERGRHKTRAVRVSGCKMVGSARASERTLTRRKPENVHCIQASRECCTLRELAEDTDHGGNGRPEERRAPAKRPVEMHKFGFED